jgi:hypothetical protein
MRNFLCRTLIADFNFLIFTFFTILVFIHVTPTASVAATAEDLARLDRAMAFWESRLNFCEGYLSKEEKKRQRRKGLLRPMQRRRHDAFRWPDLRSW